MSLPASYRVFVSAVSGELASYREEVARVLRRKGIDVCEEKHFRQGGATLLEKLNDYIANCDAIIFLIGDQCGSQLTEAHSAVMGDSESFKAYCYAKRQNIVSYTQWEWLLAKDMNKKCYAFLTTDGFKPDGDNKDNQQQRAAQASFRDWIKQTGKDRNTLTTVEQLIEDVLVLPFPDLTKGQPNNLTSASLGSLFKGRDQFLEDLHQQLNHAGDGASAITDKANPQRARAMHGSGGIGKTRAAIEYAWRNASDYSALLFITAQTPQMLQSGLAGLTDTLSMTELAQAPDEQRINAVLNWLQTNSGWFLILDNVDTDDAAEAVKGRLPSLTHGHVLITSRLSQWSAGVKTLDLGVLDLPDAVAYLLDATDANRTPTEQDKTSAEQVAEKTGQLALGLEHAAAFINARYVGFSDYLMLWENNESSILKTFDPNLIDYPQELLVTWTLSVDQLDDQARELLDVLSWLSPEPIPDSFFEAAPDDGRLEMREAMAMLCKYSLANRVQEAGQSGFQLHRLVQSTTRHHQLQEQNNELLTLDKALSWINDAYQGTAADVRDWPKLEPLAGHVKVLCEYADQHQKIGKNYPTSRLLNDLAQLYDNKARYAEAEPLMRRALRIDEQSFGEDHPMVAIRLNNLAQLLKATNRLSEAEPLMRRALSIDEQSFGEEHPRVAMGLNNLAQLLQATNRLSEAEPLMRRALSIDEQSFGEDHPDVARDLNNLAQLLQDTNRLSEAEPLMRRVVEIFHQFGQSTQHEHPHMQAAINNYSNLLIESGLTKDEANEQIQDMLDLEPS